MRGEGAVDVALETEDGEGGQSAVYLQQLAQVVDDDLAIDDVEAANGGIGHDAMEGLVDGTLNLYLALQQMVQHIGGDMAGQLVVDDVGSLVEDGAEDAVVELLFVVGDIGLQQSCYIMVVEL